MSASPSYLRNAVAQQSAAQVGGRALNFAAGQVWKGGPRPKASDMAQAAKHEFGRLKAGFKDRESFPIRSENLGTVAAPLHRGVAYGVSGVGTSEFTEKTVKYGEGDVRGVNRYQWMKGEVQSMPESVLPKSLQTDTPPEGFAARAIWTGYNKPVGAAEQLFQPSPVQPYINVGPYKGVKQRPMPVRPLFSDTNVGDPEDYYQAPKMGSGPRASRRSTT